MREHIYKRQTGIQSQKFSRLFCFAMGIGLIMLLSFCSIITSAATTKESYKYYTSIQIEEGDTLWEIANEYMTEEYADINQYIEEVCAINHISKDEIHAGRYIVIPYYSSGINITVGD